MNAARRQHKRRSWPRGLREPRPGYYAWEHPDGRILPIGRVPLSVAMSEATAANLHLEGLRPTLVDRLAGSARSVSDVLDKMPAKDKPNTIKTLRSLDKIVRAALGTIACKDLTVRHCAELLEGIADSGKVRSAQAVRSRLIAVCARAGELGWMERNPASSTRNPSVVVKRGRLTLETFQAIYAKAGEVAEWLPLAMMLGIVTGADRSTIAGLQRADVGPEHLTLHRGKTGVRIEVPLRLRLDVLGVSLADLLAQKTGVISPFVVHHVNVWGNAPAGSKVHPDKISHAFTDARKVAGIPDESAPTLHELRSLCKRLYESQGNVDTKALLGHKSEKMASLYADPRGVEAIRVKVG